MKKPKTIFLTFLLFLWESIMISALSPRQSLPQIPINDIPPSCSENCTAPLTTLQNCANSANITCICSPTMETNFVNCFVCLGGLSGDFNTSQQALNELVGACDSFGLSLSPFAFPGQTSTAPQLLTDTSAPTSSLVPAPSTTITLQEASNTPVDTPQPTSSGILTPTSAANSKLKRTTKTIIVWVMASAFLTYISLPY